VLVAVLAMLAIIGANSGYLAAVTFAEWSTGETFQNWLYQWMFLAHLVLGFLFVTPFLIFGVIHMLNTRNRKNRRAVRVGYALFAASLVVLVSGGLLFGMRATNLAARLPAGTCDHASHRRLALLAAPARRPEDSLETGAWLCRPRSCVDRRNGRLACPGPAELACQRPRRRG
jgi:NADH:ubiquinone oxidoreductase subunit 5 (subunit L)/multisubunit Na+/H+ antiporter MnhA subunit